MSVDKTAQRDNGRALRIFRELAGLTMDDLSDLFGAPVTTISAIERGETILAGMEPLMVMMFREVGKE